MAATLAPAHSGFSPPIPQTFEDLGISQSLVLDLVLRRLLLEGFSNLQSLSNTLKLSVPILNIVFTHMRQQQLVEVKGMLGNDYNFTLSQSGQNAGGRALSDQPIRRRRAGVLEGLPQRHQIAGGAGPDRPQNPALGVFGSGGERSAPRSARPGADLAKLHLRLRAHRQRQNQPGGKNAARLSGRRADALRRGSGQPGDQPVRPGGASEAGHGRSGRGSALGPVPPALHRGGWRTDSQHAGIAPGRSVGYLRGAAADEGQQRHLHHRRLRPPVDVAARPAESLDCSRWTAAWTI